MATEEVSPSDFLDERAALAFETIVQLDASGRRVDVLMVAEALSQRGMLATIGGPAFLANLQSSAFPNVVEHSRAIREGGARRALRRVALEIAEVAKQDVGTVAELMETAGQKFQSVLLQRQRASWLPMSTLVEEALTLLDTMQQEGGLSGLGTGFPDVDRVLAGMQGGDLIVLAARPGVGKTSFAMQVAQTLALGEKRVPVGVVSLEMPRRQLVLRMAAAEARIPADSLRRGRRLSPSEQERLTDGMQRLFDAPIHIDDASGISPLDLRAKARRLKQQVPELGLLIIDYLQLMKVKGRVESRQVEVAEISRSLKELAKELDIPILALSQLNRKVEERKGPPMLSDLRESGAIEQDADVVMFLHREKSDDEADAAPPSPSDLLEVEVVIAKQRNGPIGNASLMFSPAFTRFESRSSRH